MTATAKNNLYEKANLKDNQILANITLDDRRKYLFPIIFEREIIITGDVIEFTNKNTHKIVQSDSIKPTVVKDSAIITTKTQEYAGFKIGEKIIFNLYGESIEGELMEINNGFAIIKYSKNNQEKTTDRPINEIKKK